MQYRSAILALSSLAAIATAQSALAQVTDITETTRNAEIAGNIVVTAPRQSESLQDTPTVVTALNGDSGSDCATYVPGTPRTFGIMAGVDF